jgi:phage host-nuclease inhibitor protein Gam
MTKQHKKDEFSLTTAEIKRASDVALADIADCCKRIDALKAEAEASVQVIQANYGAMLTPLQSQLARNVAWLKDTMKSNKKTLFDGTDIVRLPHGSLIHIVADKVSIPRDALAKCDELGFEEVIRISKSLDRDAVEQWPDERLILIGAERKQKEEFSYDLKEEKR